MPQAATHSPSRSQLRVQVRAQPRLRVLARSPALVMELQALTATSKPLKSRALRPRPLRLMHARSLMELLRPVSVQTSRRSQRLLRLSQAVPVRPVSSSAVAT